MRAVCFIGKFQLLLIYYNYANPISKSRTSQTRKTLVAIGFEHFSIMIILTKNTWFHWLFWRMKWHIFSRLHDEKIWVWKRQFYKQDASLVWRQDAIQVANICKRLYRLHDDFFEILIFRAWERKIRWQKNVNELPTNNSNQTTYRQTNELWKQIRYSLLSDK